MAVNQASFGNRTDWAADLILVVLFSAMLVIALTAVFFRYVMNHSLVWSDEVVRYLFVWFTLLGAAIALRDREHIRVEYFVELLPPGVRRFVELVTLVSVLLFYMAMLVLGLMWVRETSGTSTSALKWPLNWFFYAALPVSAMLGAWYSLRRLKSGEYSELVGGRKSSEPAAGRIVGETRFTTDASLNNAAADESGKPTGGAD